MKPNPQPPPTNKPKDTHFEVVANRGKASFKVRYVETNQTSGCRFAK